MANNNYNYPYYPEANPGGGGNTQVDLAEIFRKIRSKWYYFAISTPLFLAFAFYSIKSSPRAFAVNKWTSFPPIIFCCGRKSDNATRNG